MPKKSLDTPLGFLFLCFENTTCERILSDMEHEYWMDSCSHAACEPMNRMEYCVSEPEELSYEIYDIIESIEEAVLTVDQLSTDHSYSGNREESAILRSFEFDLAPSNELCLMNIRRTLDVCIEQKTNPSCRIYNITEKWLVNGEDEISAPFTRLYTIEVYPSGFPQCTVTEPDMAPAMEPVEQYVDRTMSGYDARELWNLVENLHTLQRATLL